MIPAGDSFADSVIAGFCGIVEWGSGTLIAFTTSPTRVVLGLVLVTLALSWLARRTDWEKVAPLPLRRRRRAGQIMRLAGTAFLRRPRSFLVFGSAAVPAVALGSLVAVALAAAPVISDILGHTDGAAGSDLFLSLIAGGIPHIITLVFVNAAMAAYIDRAGTEDPLSAADAIRLAWGRRRDLGIGLVRATAVVVGLLVTVVGTPWALRQLIRYQFMPVAVMTDGLDGRAGLARSSELTRGRWWHTALFLATLNTLILGVALTLGIVLLVVFASLPLVVFSVLISMLFALLTPVSALALTMLCGDAMAERSQLEAAEQRTGDDALEGVPA